MHQYQISTGEWTHDGISIGFGYSGLGPYRNDPGSVALHGLGAIPPGDYSIGDEFDSPNTGPCVMRLTPKPGTNTYGRTDFELHGNNSTNTASRGCIIEAHSARVQVSQSTDKDLRVIP